MAYFARIGRVKAEYLSSSNYLKGKMRNISPPPGVLHCHRADVSFGIKVNHRIFIKQNHA